VRLVRGRAPAAFLAAAILSAAGFGSSWLLSAGATSAVLPRVTTDRPDDSAAPQIHVIYALPSDGVDRVLDEQGTLNDSVASWNTWLATQTGGLDLRLDTSNGMLDTTFVRLPESDAQIEARGAFVRDELEKQLHTLGFNQPQKIYAVYYDGRSSFACGGGAWPPVLAGNVAALYLHGLYSGPVPCDTNRWGSVGGPRYLEFAMIHELLHTLGFVPTCAPHHTSAGHVSDSPADLMYAGSAPWTPSTLDVGHDDYYDAKHTACLDLSASVYLTSGESVPTTTALTVGTTAVTTPTLPECTVPNVKGRTLAAAQRALAAKSCRTGTVKRAYSANVKTGRVISQKPAAGKTLRLESKVDLIVSRGRRRKGVRVGHGRGLTPDMADSTACATRSRARRRRPRSASASRRRSGRARARAAPPRRA
jgi:hypothetical protein